MKLRNKRTGMIVECENIVFTHCNALALDWKQYTPGVNSLAELNEEWEDYKPAEPLIKDEKIRKAVRAWAEVNDIERVWHEYSSNWLRGNGLTIELENEVVELEQGNYSIEELCGEEEE